MKCPSCGQPNPRATKFCGDCGARLASICSACGTANPPTQRFCGDCGHRLAADGPEPEGHPAPPEPDPGARVLQPGAGERRHLTVMFCDLVGSTSLSERLDPEDLRDVVRQYQDACAAFIARFDGYVSQYLGDGLLVYFGYPHAHEDDPLRAARAALQIVAGVSNLTAETGSGRVRLSVRIGIHSGFVVVGEVGSAARHEPLALGKTPNLAARLQDLAAPNRVVVSAETHRLIGHGFVCRDLGTQAIKGLSAPIRAYEVVCEADPGSRGDAVTAPGLPELIGRGQELAILRECWEQVRDGYGQTVLLAGDAGIGKSRLVAALRQELTVETTRWECRCSPYHQDSALHPIIDLFGRIFDFERDEPAPVRLKKIEAALDAQGLTDGESLWAWASLLSVPLPPASRAPELSPSQQKRQIFRAVMSLLQATASRQPLLFVVEDLHWADASTLEFLELAMDQALSAPVLLLLVFRPEFHATWRGRVHLTHLTLNRFTRGQTELMVERVAAGKLLPSELLQQIVRKTDGVPLFTEELTKMVLESGLLRELDDRYELTGPLPVLGIPSTLYDSLMARLDRLGPAKDLAQLCAVLGRTFPYELLRGVARLDEAALQRDLARLVEAGLLHQRGLPHRPSYSFKHVMIQEAAYESLLKGRRQQYHEQVARTLAERFPETRETEPELLAHHYAEAGLAEEASGLFQAAGRLAIGRSANVEAVGHLSHSLELLRSLPETAERHRQELALQVTLGAALIATKGYAAAEVESAYTRARELCRHLGTTPQLFPVLRGLAAFYYVRGELHTARELGEQFLALAHSEEDVALRVGAHLELGSTLFNLGELTRAREHFETGIGLYDPAKDRPQAVVYGQDLGVSCLSRLAMALACLGYLDQALAKSEEAVRLAETLAHPYTRAYALSFAAVVRRLRGEAAAVQELADAVLRLSSDQGFPFWASVAGVLKGWALVEQGHLEAGLAEMREGLGSWRALGAGVPTNYFLAEVAAGCRRAGRTDEGLALVDEGLALAGKTDDRWYEAVLHRIKGELVLDAGRHGSRPGAREEAERCFRQAIAIARDQRAKSFELAAATSLVELGPEEGRADARRLLADVYGWFTEGRDTLDLTRARSVLDFAGAG